MSSAPAYLTGSEAAFLRAIWQTSVVLAIVSFVIVVILILRRAADERQESHRQLRREVISQALLAAMSAPMAPTFSSLPKLLRFDEPLIVRSALDLLRAIGGADIARIVQVLRAWGLTPYMRETLNSGRRGERIQTLTLLAHFDDEDSLGLLYEHAESRDPYVQLAALRSLAEHGAEEHLPHILAQLGRSDQHNTLVLADILQRFGEPAAPMLAALAAAEAAVEVRLAAILALGTIGTLASVEPLIALSGDRLPDVRAQVIAALARINDTRAAPVVLRGLDERDEAVRVQAAQAAGSLKLQKALPKLAELLSDASWWVRYRAAEALLRLGAASLLQAKALHEDTAGSMARMVLAEKGAS